MASGNSSSKKKNRYDDRDIYRSAILIMLIMLAYLAFQNLVLTERIDDRDQFDEVDNHLYNNETIIDSIEKRPSMDPYSDYDKSIEIITGQEISDKAKSEPVIYGDLDKSKAPLYKVTYGSGEDGLLIIYDKEDDSILKIFRTSNIILD